ncbi:MAG: hypothetical protein JWL62_2488 [Hyphomicrobiales bacterium]|nr:hypothetical protein [Hyphomicrobiales bacterium]
MLGVCTAVFVERLVTPSHSIEALRSLHNVRSIVRTAPLVKAVDAANTRSSPNKLAEGVGFEPTVGFHPRRFSRPLP